MNNFYFDLETSPLSPEALARVMPDFQAKANLVDPKKIEADIAEKKSDFLDKAALKAYTGQIIAVGMAADENEPDFFANADEQTLVQLTFHELQTRIGLNANIYTWNGAGFDLPFLCQRCAVYGIPAFKFLAQRHGSRFNWHPCFIDAKLVWSNYSPDHTGTSLDTVSKALGVGEKTGKGKDFAELLKSDPIKAKEYCKQDVNLLRAVVKRMGI